MRQALIFSIWLLISSLANAAEIRLYTIDKFGRQDTVNLWLKGDKPGCHNFRKPREIFRVAVIGKGACAIYAEPDCAPQSKLAAQWKNRKTATTLLTPGSRWLFGQKEKIVEIRPEIDDVDEHTADAKVIAREKPVKNATGNKSKVSKVDEASYDVVVTDSRPSVETGPRLEAIHIPLTIDVRSWQCVDKY